MENTAPPLLKVTFDGIELEVPAGTTIMQAGRMLGRSEERRVGKEC